jgi:hypothetical protein
MREYYAKNRILYEVHTRPVLERLTQENVRIVYSGPYPMNGFYVNLPVYLLEEFNARSDVVQIELDIPARVIQSL